MIDFSTLPTRKKAYGSAKGSKPSAILINGKRANYYKLIASGEYTDCTEAVQRIAPRIDLQAIN